MNRAISFRVDGVPGLEGASVQIPPGTSVVPAERDQRGSRLFQCLRIALGSDEADLPLDGDRAQVQMCLDDVTYERIVERIDGGLTVSGRSYLDDPELADLYAFVLGTVIDGQSISNTAVLRDLLFQPSSVEKRRAEATQLATDVSEVNQRLASIEASEEKYSSLADRRESLEAHIERIETRLERTDAELGQPPTTNEWSDDGMAEEMSEDITPSEMERVRREIRDVRYDIHTTYEGLVPLHEERRAAQVDRKERTEGTGSADGDRSADVRDLRREKERLQRSLRTLQDVIELASGLLDGGRSGELAHELAESRDSDRDSIEQSTAAVCWLCGSPVDSRQVEDTVETLRSIRSTKMAEMDEIDAALGERERDHTRKAVEGQRGSSRTVPDVDADIEVRRESLATLRERRSALVDTLERHQDALESEHRPDSHEPGADDPWVHERDANRRILELHRADVRWEEVMERTIQTVERLETRDRLRAERARKEERRARLQREIDGIESGVVDRFNDEIRSILRAVDPEPVDDVWIERRTDDAGRTNGGPDRTVPEVYVTPDADSREDSELTVDRVEPRTRDVAAFVVRLAGYFVYDVHESVPFMLVEPPAGVAGDGVENLLARLAGVPDYLVVSTPRSIDPESVNAAVESVTTEY